MVRLSKRDENCPNFMYLAFLFLISVVLSNKSMEHQYPSNLYCTQENSQARTIPCGSYQEISLSSRISIIIKPADADKLSIIKNIKADSKEALKASKVATRMQVSNNGTELLLNFDKDPDNCVVEEVVIRIPYSLKINRIQVSHASLHIQDFIRKYIKEIVLTRGQLLLEQLDYCQINKLATIESYVKMKKSFLLAYISLIGKGSVLNIDECIGSIGAHNYVGKTKIAYPEDVAIYVNTSLGNEDIKKALQYPKKPDAYKNILYVEHEGPSIIIKKNKELDI